MGGSCYGCTHIVVCYMFWWKWTHKRYLYLFMQLNFSMIGQRCNVCIAGKRSLILSLSKALGLKRFVTVSVDFTFTKKSCRTFHPWQLRKTLYLSFFLQEDDKIIDLVRKYGPTKWSIIAKSLPGRIGKQCRERYSSDHVQIIWKVACSILDKPSNWYYGSTYQPDVPFRYHMPN
jgi:hypothetical protein